MALLLTTPIALAAADADTVNERLPVNKAELEAHWQVDCAASWQDLHSAVLAAGPTGCAVPADLAHAIKLCAFIYQPPGQAAARACPDYAQALRQLARPGDSAACRALLTLIEAGAVCLTIPVGY